MFLFVLKYFYHHANTYSLSRLLLDKNTNVYDEITKESKTLGRPWEGLGENIL